MSDLHTLIQERLQRDESPVYIAQALDIPLSWVYEVLQQVDEECSPYATINS
jgi:hypothetical protein